MIVRQVVEADHDACARIVTALPDWFTPDVPATVRRDLGEHGGWVVRAAVEPARGSSCRPVRVR